MNEDVLITTDMNWYDVAEALCTSSHDALELMEAAASFRDRLYGEEQERLLNRHQDPEVEA